MNFFGIVHKKTFVIRNLIVSILGKIYEIKISRIHKKPWHTLIYPCRYLPYTKKMDSCVRGYHVYQEIKYEL